MKAKVFWQLIGLILLMGCFAAAISIAVSNYAECRKAGFSILYCATTHLVK
jgi:hypothetical protein